MGDGKNTIVDIRPSAALEVLIDLGCCLDEGDALQMSLTNATR